MSRSPSRSSRAPAVVPLLLLISAIGPAESRSEDRPPARPYQPPIAPASEEGERAIRSFRVPEGLKVELFAAEPLLANPVAFCIDEHGVFYVAETFRHGAGVTDTRGHMDWLDDDLACRTVADRVAMYRRYLGPGFEAFKVEHERVRRVVDRDGDGRADAATVFADGFNDPAAGIGAGLLARKGDVYYACIPWLWKLRDTEGQGQATERTLLHEGYGVHVGFLGHDLHGLKMGPDGRLYFTIGDRGFRVRTREGNVLTVPDTGTVLRCEPDGTKLEVFAAGLRNPQEVAFDEYGNLFTCDNNSDSGDKARWVHLVEGGDSGWRIGYQFMEEPYSRGPWNEEMLWDPDLARKAGYLLPPLANISDGPSGLAYHPGVSTLPDRYRGHFFLVDFRGSSGQSGIRSLALKPKGASFELSDPGEFVWRALATDVDFGPDGHLYFSDWVEGWEKPQKGRIYRVSDPSRRADPAVAEVRRLLGEGMEQRSPEGLVGLLAHADMRVRQEAQYELARRGAAEELASVARSARGRLPRVHALWGLGQVARRKGGSPGAPPRDVFVALLADPDAEIRAQAAMLAGEARDPAAFPGLVALLRDSEPRVRSFAATSLGKLGRREAFEPLLALLRENQDRDPYLRHAAVMGLAGLADIPALERAATDGSPSVRRGVLLSLRRLGSPSVATFLGDADPDLVLEAARAINDVPIDAALPRLAAMEPPGPSSLPLLRRVANARFRLGRSEDAAALAATAAREALPEAVRVLALEMLAEWPRPSGRDKVVGLWRPLPARPDGPAADALRPGLDALLMAGTDAVRRKAIQAAAALAIKDAAPRLVALAADARLSDASRTEALRALEAFGDPGLAALARQLVRTAGPRARIAAVRILVRDDPCAARTAIDEILRSGTSEERQGIFAILAASPDPAADKVLADWLDRLLAGAVPDDVRLDLLEAAERKGTEPLRARLERYQASKPKDDPLAPYRETLTGGNADRGREIFLTKSEVSCLRCHKIADREGDAMGGEVGPELIGVGGRQPRDYLLESIVAPDRKIAEGFESVVVATADGKVLTGVLKGEDREQLRLVTAEGHPVTIAKSEIEERRRGPSAMPADLVTKLSRSEIRDLVEFLATSKGK
ncbi:MAG: PVC-type heme-binding CxxCH protein [Isosphaeraceae bacterium]